MTGELRVERDGEVAIVEAQAPVTLGCGLRERMKELAQSGVKCMLLDFSQVAEIDSAGLGELVGGYASAMEAGCSTILLNVNRRWKELLLLTRLTGVFPIYDGAASVVRSVLANRLPVRREAEARLPSELYIG